MHTDRTVDRNDLEARARRRVRAKTGFFVHALVFVLVNAGMALVNEMSGGHRWHHFPLMGWGLGLGIHGLVVFLRLSTDGLRQRMFEREMALLQRRQGA